MAIDFSTFTEAQQAAIDKWSPETQSFMDEWAAANEGDKPATVVKRYLAWGNNLNNKSTYKDKLGYVKETIYRDTPALYKEGVLPAAADWIDLNNPNILDANGMPFTSGFYKDIISGDATTQKTNTATLDAARKTSATDYVNKTLNAKGTLDAKTIASSIDEIINGTKTKPYNPTKLAEATSAVRGTAAYKPGDKTFDQLKATYGGLLDPSGKPVFSDKDLKAVANAQTLGEISNFNTKLNRLADSVLKSQGSSYVSLDPVKKAEAKQALFRDPTTFVTSVNGLNKTNKTNLGAPSTLTGGAGIDTLTPAKSLKTWKAPQQPKDGVYTATANSPYSGLLDAILSKVTGTTYGDPTINEKYKNLTDPLTQGMGLDSLPKPKLIYDTADTAGITGLGGVKGTLQPLNTQVTSTPTYNSNQIANANTALENAANIAGKVVDPGIVKPLVKTPAELAAEKFAVDKASYMNSFNARDYIEPSTRTRADLQTVAKTDPKMAAQLDWSAQLDQSPADFKSKVGMTSAEIAANKPQSATTVNTTTAPQFTSGDYIPPANRAVPIFANNPALADQIAWSATQDAAQAKQAGIVSPNVSNTVSTGNMNTYATGPNGEAGIPSALTTAPQFTSGDYIPPANRTLPIFANNPALAGQVAWSATQDAAQAKQAAPAVGINTLPNSTGATGTTTPAPFTVNSTTSYSPSDYSPELKAALAARAASMGK